MSAEATDFSSTGFFGFGPSTPRQASVPQRHSWMFFWEKGLGELDVFSTCGTAKDLLKVVVVGQLFSSHDPPTAGE
jgi:hypothetical protein